MFSKKTTIIFLYFEPANKQLNLNFRSSIKYENIAVFLKHGKIPFTKHIAASDMVTRGSDISDKEVTSKEFAVDRRNGLRDVSKMKKKIQIAFDKKTAMRAI